jgi:hypothetical protein
MFSKVWKNTTTNKPKQPTMRYAHFNGCVTGKKILRMKANQQNEKYRQE